MSSGVLPFYEFNGILYILLGKENGSWSGFSGKQEVNETLKQTAFREFHEETSNTFIDMTMSYLNENTLDIIVTKTPTGKEFSLYLINFNETLRDVSSFRLNRTLSQLKCEKEKEDIRWVPLQDIQRKYKLRYCFFKDLNNIQQVFKNKNIIV
jgi:8-oxo-dGTP pyrophosphatase MutT (NUDIX family)